MSAANLNEIKKKYNFKEISVATWRDPYAPRAGPDSPRFSPNTTFVPTYKANYDSTDDEGSVVDGDDEPDAEEASNRSILEDNLDEPATNEQQLEVPVEQLPEDEQNLESRDQIDESERIDAPDQDTNEVNVEPDMAKSDAIDTSDAVTDAVIEVPEEGGPPPEAGDSGVITLELADDGLATPPSDAGSDERRVSFAPGTSDPKPTPRKKKAAKGTKGKKKRIAVPIDSLPPDVMAMIDGAFDGLPPPPAMPTPAPEPPAEDNTISDDDTKPVEPVDDEAHLDAQPAEEPTVDEPAPMAAPDEPVLEQSGDLPAKSSAETANEEAAETQEVEQTADHTPAPLLPEESQAEVAPTEPVEDAPVATEKSSKKKSSKSGKDKEKSKKKSSKSKSREISPLLPAGLGIDLPPLPPALGPDDSTNMTQEVAMADHPESATDAAPSEDMEKTINEGKAEPENEDQRHSVADIVPDTNSSADGKNEPGDEDHADRQDSAENRSSTEPEENVGENVEDQQDIPDAWDEPEDAANPTNAPTTVGDEASGEAAPLESASSPADSGVEFEDDASKAAGNEGEGKSPETIDEAASNKPNDAGEHIEEKDTSAAPESEASTEDQKGDHEVIEATPEVREVQPKTDEPELETAVGDGGEQVAHEDIADAEASSKPNAEDEESSKEEPKSDEGSADQVGDSVAEGAAEEQPAENAAAEGGADLKDEPTGDSGIEPQSEKSMEDTPSPEEAVAETETACEPPTVECAPEETKVDPFEFEVVAEPDEAEGAEFPQETSREVGSVSEAPLSPVLSKSDSQGSKSHKADHWEREHTPNALKEVFEDSKVLERSHSKKDGKGELRVRDRHRKSRRKSSSEEDEEARKRRRAARKAEEAARVAKEASRKAEEERKYQEQRVARKRAATESSSQKDSETRQRHTSRDSDRDGGRTTQALKATLPFALPAIPKALKLTSGASVHGAAVVRSYGGAYRPAAKETTRAAAPTSAPRDEPASAPKEVSREARTASPPSSDGEKSHHRRRHRSHRSEGDRSSRNDTDSDRHRRRPLLVEERVQERPRSFFGLVRI